jgi:L-rhamnose mutarotase
MNRIGFQFKVRPDRLAEYIEYHKHVWTEMLEALRETGGTTTHYSCVQKV